MSVDTHLAFRITRSHIRDGILIPKFYDPELAQDRVLAESIGYDVIELRDLLFPSDSGSRLGDWIRREHYGTGDIPYVRTSDLSQWRIRPDYKKGVAEDVYLHLRERQDIQPYDLLFVAHGTYLIGTAALVLRHETKMVLQDHVFRLRIREGTGVRPELLLALLSTSFVRRQVRARQFSADIIDKIGARHLGIGVPVPQDPDVRDDMVRRVRRVLAKQTRIRRKKRELIDADLRLLRERAASHYGFSVARRSLRNRILIPKYYDPDIERDLHLVQARHGVKWITLGDLVHRGLLAANTGVEVGKMAYGTGDVPFIRTSDLVEWEVKSDVRQGVSEDVYAAHERKAAVSAGDVLLVRDGTYLVGASALVSEQDVPGLICGGMYRLRSNDWNTVNPYALLAFLNLPIVRRQMRARQFTRDVIDTLGNRLLEVRIPNPDSELGQRMGDLAESVMREKERVKEEVGRIIGALEPPCPPVARGRPGWSMR